ncbi:MAG: response regulator transcription factor [Acaryochloridaceae cyanobacterium SU_2_1]|nr:response regulator transcription factor [Acaryochloridaceae cyanobacterium SU_2_1]NJM95507.1 response regulator transcription factor [Acaryochloridaceae cyanobacterium CSU_5_19]
MPLTVMVIDDELGIRLAVSDFLESCGYTVITAATGQQGWQLVQDYRPHLLVTDIRMPELDGYELVKRIRQLPIFRLLPVIYLTECNETEERVRAYQTGCDLYLTKPFELDELQAAVRNLLDRAQIIQSELHQATPHAVSNASTIDSEAVTPLNLTPREQEVLVFLTEGLSNSQIGDRLHLSPRTIEKYVSKLLQKAEAYNRADLVRFAIENRLIHSVRLKRPPHLNKRQHPEN